MKRFKITGKSHHMRSVLLANPKTGEMYQRPIRLGIVFEVNENEITPHVQRQEAKKVLLCCEIVKEEKKKAPKPEAAAPAPVKEKPATKKKKTSRRRRG